MDFLPLFCKLQQQPCLIVGGGNLALRKAKLLVAAGANVRIVAPDVIEPLSVLIEPYGKIVCRGYQSADLQGIYLVIAATDDAEINSSVSKDAQALGIPVNVVDQPELCTFIFPAIVDRSPLVVAVSSGGKSPVLARLLRARLESLVPAAYGRLTTLVGDFRERVKQRIAEPSQRRIFWEEVLQGPVAELVLAGKDKQANSVLAEALRNVQLKPPQSGEVYLVGAGPGDPDLLTFRALRLMQQADVVLYDRLVSPAVLELCRRDADMIHVGKARDNHTVPQQDINKSLADLALQGKRVLRLKGGDPFIFGRGGEEIDSLMEQGVPFQVVPGITAASGCAAYAGIPLTHRDHAQSVQFLTGHMKDGSCDLDWGNLSADRQTLVFYMSLVSLPLICSELIAHGKAATTPAALIEKGTLPEQRVFIGTLASIAGLVDEAAVRAPTLLIIGSVVNLQEKLNWRGDS